MADVTPTRPTSVGNSDIFEYAYTATNKTMAPLQLDPKKSTTIAIQTAGSATVLVELYFEDPDNAGAVAYPFVAAAATAASVDYIKSSLGPIAGIECTGTVSGGDTATIQVIQSESN